MARKLRRVRGGGRGWAAVLVTPVMTAATTVTPATVVAPAGLAAAGVAAAAVVATVHGRPALAAGGTVLVLSTSVNGGASSGEAQAATSLGATVTVATPATWDAMTTAQFKTYSALVIGDPSSAGTCATSVPSDALSTAATWGAAVTGNVSVLGTAPVQAGSAGSALLTDGISFALAGSGTGLYVSLNCEYSGASAGAAVPLLAGVASGGFRVTGQAASCPSNAGTVNTWASVADVQFRGLTSSAIGPWASPACSVQETFTAWPAGLGGLAYDKAATPGTFTASDGASGQAYVLAGALPSAGTVALAPSTGGEVPAETTVGGTNPAAPAATQASAGDPVDTENGDFSQSSTDLSIPTFGPDLSFSRTYDALLAQQQTQSGSPGPMGYGWTDNWATSLSAGSSTPGNIYTIDGLETNTGNGGPPAQAAMLFPASVHASGGDIYITDTQGNKIEEIPGTSKTQWGIAMTAGHIYTIAGSDTGASGDSGNGTLNTKALLSGPGGVALDDAGDLYIADAGNSRVVEIAAAAGTQWGTIAMTANHLYTVAGRPGQPALGNDNKPAIMSDLASPTQVFIGGNAGGNLYIADTGNSRIQMVSGTTQTKWGQSMTANDVYTVAGSAAGTFGSTGDGQNAQTTALLFDPQDVCISSAGDMYIADTLNNRVQEVAKATGTEWGISQTADDMYTVVGNAAGNAGSSANGTAAASAHLSNPSGIACPGTTQLYVTDSDDNEIQEVPSAAATAWGVTMAADKIYTIAGSVATTEGFAGDGGAAASALLDTPTGTAALDSSGNLDLADSENDEVRQVSPSSFAISDYAGGAGTFSQEGDGGAAVNAALADPNGIASDAAGDVFIADTAGNRVQEIAASSHTQFGIAMTAGDVYTVAGSAAGMLGVSGNGQKATLALLNGPASLAFDGAGNLYIDDNGNCRIQEVSVSTDLMSTIAGSAAGDCGDSGNGGPATSALLSDPFAVAADAGGDVFIAGGSTNQVQEVPATTGGGMTKGDIYTIAGSTTGNFGSSGDGGPAASSLLNDPGGVSVDAAGNVYISDTSNYRIQEIAGSTHTQLGQAMTKGDIYTIAGTTGDFGNSGDGGPATSAKLDLTGQIALDSSGDLYITDLGNNQIREIAASNGTQWSQLMTAGDIYTVAGSAAGTIGTSGDGGPATAALMNEPDGIAVDPAGDLFITDAGGNRLREVAATSTPVFAESPVFESPQTGGITVAQADGSQVTFYPKSGSTCAAPYTQAAGGYCTLPLDLGASLTFNSASNTYTFSPSPGTTYTYGSNGALQAQADSAGDTLTITYGTPAPGTGNCPATAASCKTITSASGRALVVGSNAAGLVTSVTDPMGRAWTYGYTGSDLTSATDPMGNVTTYAYGAGSTGNPVLANDLLTMTAPNAQPGGQDAGDSTVNAYNAAGEVTSQTDPMGFTTGFNYCVSASSGNCMNAATGTGYVTVTDPDGNTTVYGYTEGAETSESAWSAGTTLESEQDFVPAQTASGSSAGTQLDTMTADGQGNITTNAFDAAGNDTSTTMPDGIGSQTGTTTDSFTSLSQINCDGTVQATGTGCASATPPAAVTPGGVITPPAAAPPLGETWTLFDNDGNELYSTTGVYEPGAGTAAYSQTTYQLFKGNSVTLNGSAITCTATPPSMSLPCATIATNGAVTQLAYNAQGDLVSSSAPDGNGAEVATTTYAYDADGEQTAVTSPDGNLTGANAGNYTTITAFNGDGEQTSVTQGGGTGHTVTPRVTTYGYDADGNQTTVKDARGFTATTTPNADDKPALVTNPDGNATLTCYDGDGDIAQTVPAVGVAAKSLTAASCPRAYPAGYAPATSMLASDATMSTYDGLGQLTAMYTPAPAGQTGFETTTYAYDSDGDLVTTTAPPATNGGPSQVTVNKYDDAGNLTSTTTGAGTSAASTTAFCYDQNGDQTAVVVPDGNTSGTALCETSSPYVVSSTANPAQAAYQTTYSHDSAGEVVSSTSPATSAAPSGATTAATYDSSGDTLTRTDPNGVTTTWTYTPQGQPATVTYSGSAAHSVTYSYDADGNRIGMTDATGSSTLTYDPFSELTSAQDGAGQVTGYGYSADGQVTGISYPLPASATWATTATVSYGYDNADLLTSVTDFTGKQITVGNNADGLPNSEALGTTGDSTTTTYDPNDVPSAISVKNATSTLQSFTYSDAPAGTILSETDTPSGPASPAAYTYTAQGRVASMKQGTGTTLTYGFDPSGNLTTLPAGATGSYDHGSELTSSVLAGTTTSYSYNADGERLGAAQGITVTSSATWNGAGQLASYDNAAADMTAATYDGDGDRATATAGSGAQQFTWNTTAPVPQLIMDAKNAYIYAGGNTPAEQVSLSAGTVTYLSADLLGSVRGTISSTGALTGTTSYDAWGNPVTTGGPTATTPFGFGGGYTDPDGLVYLLSRYYDPAAGAFISVDPAITATNEPYAYADDNPVTRSDPTGLTGTNWWTYETERHLSGISADVYYDESPHMAEEMRKVTGEVAAKHIDSISRWLAVLSNAIAVFVPSHPHLAAIIGFVSAAIAVFSAKRLIRVLRWVRKWTVGNGRHRGLYIIELNSETIPAHHYIGTKDRKCDSDKVTCGSPADHGKEFWPSP